jgi:UDP-glucuronate decarboxylase
VTDQIIGLLRFAGLPGLAGEVVNIGNPEEITILQLAKTIIEMTRSKSEFAFHPMPQDDPARRFPDIIKAQNKLGWNPNVSLELGLGNSIYINV